MSGEPTTAITFRLDEDAMSVCRETGEGWHTGINLRRRRKLSVKLARDPDIARIGELDSSGPGSFRRTFLGDGAVGPLRRSELITLWRAKVKGLLPNLQDQVLYGDWSLEKAYVAR